MIKLKLKTHLCPACGKKHEIIRLFELLEVAVCPILSDVVYFAGWAHKEVRIEVKQMLLGK